MNDPVAFTITVNHDPHDHDSPWSATIRNTGGAIMAVRINETRDGVVALAQSWIRTERHGREPSETIRATADGDLIYGESLKVTP